MNLKCRINNIEYDIAQGVPFSDEYNETLDSATIIIPHTKGKIADLKPYTDVYIYDNDYIKIPLKFGSYEALNEPLQFTLDKKDKDGVLFYYKWQGNFRDDFLDYYTAINPSTDIQEDFIELNVEWDDGEKSKYRYRLKKENGDFILDAIDNYAVPLTIVKDNYGNQLIEADFNGLNGKPNPKSENSIGLSANLNWYAKSFNLGFQKHFLVDNFSYQIINKNDDIRKYTIQLFSETKGLETVVLPNTTITRPLNVSKAKTVWQYLVEYVDLYSPSIKTTKYVSMETNEWIYRKKYVLDANLKSIFNNTYAPETQFDNPTFRDVLNSLMLTKDRIVVVKNNMITSIDVSARAGIFNVENDEIVDIQGSMSSSNYVDTLRTNYSNALGQDFSAKITQYIGFRNSDNALMTFDNLRLEFAFPIYKINKMLMCYYKKVKLIYADREEYKIFLCKQDITDFVLLNSKRNLLSDNWEDFANESTIEQFKKYKLTTIGYDIGSRYIDGWGTKYTYLNSSTSWFEKQATYLQNLVGIFDKKYPLGIYSDDYFIINAGALAVVPVYEEQGYNSIFTSGEFKEATKLKFIFFEVEYDAFFNGATETTKDNSYDDTIVGIDNQSTSLPSLERSGLFQKEKLNRLGNEALIIQARHNSIDKLQPLGSTYKDDYVIYHREYSVYENVINVVYYATKDYVLKNYYTSVFSKIRPFAIASYDESVNRAENKKTYLLISKDKKYYENEQTNNGLVFNDFKKSTIQTIASAFLGSERPISTNLFNYPDKVNYGIIEYNDQKYACDVNIFVHGNSLCFNLRPYDNTSAGIYIEKVSPFGETININTKDDYTGTRQAWYMTVDDFETGYVEKMGFFVGHNEQDILGKNFFVTEDEAIENYEKLFALPKLTEQTLTNAIGKVYNVYKDNKSSLDMTFQIEPVCNDDSIQFSPMFMKLSDLVGTDLKSNTDYYIQAVAGTENDVQWIYSSYILPDPLNYINQIQNQTIMPLFCFAITPERYEKLRQDVQNGIKDAYAILNYDKYWSGKNDGQISKYRFIVTSIIETSDDYIIIEGEETLRIANSDKEQVRTRQFKLKKVDYLGYDYTAEEGENKKIVLLPSDKYYFVNANYNYKGERVYSVDLYYPDYNSIINTETNFGLQFRMSVDAHTIYNVENKQQFTTENCKIIDAGGDLAVIDISKFFKTNMFVLTSKEYLNKTIVYDEQLQIKDSGIQVEEAFKFEDENIYIDLNLFPNDIKSIQYWYFDEISQSYKFVFGVNVSEQDREQGYVRLYLSLISSKNEKVYGFTQDVVGTIVNYATDTNFTYGEKQYFKEL